MASTVFPVAASGLSSVVKSIQRGTASSAGTITISAVTVAKTITTSHSTGSTGTVAATGTIGAYSGTGAAYTSTGTVGNVRNASFSGYGSGTMTIGATRYAGVTTLPFSNTTASQSLSLSSATLSGGTTALTAGAYGAVLTNSTTLTVTGACEYQVIEYN